MDNLINALINNLHNTFRNQGYKAGKTIVDKLVYIQNDDSQNYPSLYYK